MLRKSGRDSNLVKKIEEGAIQENQIYLYFSKFGGNRREMEKGHPSAKTMTGSGQKLVSMESANAPNDGGRMRSTKLRMD